MPGPLIPVGVAEATRTATVITSTSTYVAGGAGRYRVWAMGSGGVAGEGATQCGAGAGFVAYGEIQLTAAENVSVTIGAAKTGLTATSVGADGNLTKFGTYLQALGGRQGGNQDSNGITGHGYSGGGEKTVTTGGTDGSDGAAGAGGKGQGSGVLDMLQRMFPDLTLAAASAGTTVTSGSAGAQGGGGITVNGTNYGTGGAAATSGTSGASLQGVVVVAGPYT